MAKQQGSNKALAVSGTTTKAMHIIMRLGTYGFGLEKYLREHFPELWECTIAMDATIESQDLQRNDRLIDIPDEPLDAYKERAEGIPILATDNYISSLHFPFETDLGAGATRAIGMLKGSVRLEDVGCLIEKVLLNQLRDVASSGRIEVKIHDVAAFCGSTGSAMAIPVALIAKHIVYKNLPTARCTTVYHAALSNLYTPVVANPEIRNKLKANDFASMVEANFAAQQSTVTTFCKLLNLAPLRGPAIDTIIPYNSVDEYGRSYSIAETISQRLVPNILAQGDEGFRANRRERNSNPLAMNAALSADRAKPMVEMTQASVAHVPPKLATTWSMDVAVKKFRLALLNPSDERIAQLATSLEENLKLGQYKNEIAAAFTKTRTSMVILPEGFRKKSAGAAETDLRAAYKRHISTTNAEIRGVQHTLNSRYKAVTIPEASKAQLEWLIEQADSLPEISESLSRVRKSLHKIWERSKDELTKLSSVVQARRDNFVALLNGLRKRFVTGSAKVRAAESLNLLFEAEVAYREAECLLQLIAGFITRLQTLTAQVKDVQGEVLSHQMWVERELTKSKALVTGQAVNLTSVIEQDELDRLISDLTDKISSIPDLDLKGIVEGEANNVPQALDRYTQDLADRYREHVETNFPDVASFVRAFGLRFSVERWLNGALEGLACPSPVPAGVLGATPPQTVLVASGRDSSSAKTLVSRSQTLKYIEIVEGNTRRSLSVVRFVEGLTVKNIPTFTEGMRAALSYPKPGTTDIPAWNTIASSGYMLPAFQQAGLVPPEWLEKPSAKRSRISTTVASRNGDNDDE